MALSPANEPIYYYANDSRTKSFTVTDGDEAAVDLSSSVLKFTIRKRKGGTVIYTLSTATGSIGGDITVSGASNNIVNIAFNHDLEERSYYYDLYDQTNDETIMYGKLIVTEEIHE
jgi:hypothetical protein